MISITDTNNILSCIKKMSGIYDENNDFDPDIITNINTVFGILHQLNIGPANGFSLFDGSETWDQFLEDGPTLNIVKTYISSKVRMVFDPPTIGCVMDALKNTINELEWRLRIAGEQND